MKKRLLSLVLTLAMVVSLFAGMTVTAGAAESTGKLGSVTVVYGEYAGENEPFWVLESIDFFAGNYGHQYYDVCAVDTAGNPLDADVNSNWAYRTKGSDDSWTLVENIEDNTHEIDRNTYEYAVVLQLSGDFAFADAEGTDISDRVICAVEKNTVLSAKSTENGAELVIVPAPAEKPAGAELPIVSSPAPGVLRIYFENADKDGYVSEDDILFRVYKNEQSEKKYITTWTDISRSYEGGGMMDGGSYNLPDHTVYLEPLTGGTYGVEACYRSALGWDDEADWEDASWDEAANPQSQYIAEAMWDAIPETPAIAELPGGKNDASNWKVAEISDTLESNTIDLTDAEENTYIAGYTWEQEIVWEDMQTIFLASDATVSGAEMYKAAGGYGEQETPNTDAFKVAYVSFGEDLSDEDYYGGYKWYKVHNTGEALTIQVADVAAPTMAELMEATEKVEQEGGDVDDMLAVAEELGIPGASVMSYNYTCDPAVVLDNVVTAGTMQLVGSGNEGCINVTVKGKNFLYGVGGFNGKTVISGNDENASLTAVQIIAGGNLQVENLKQFESLMAMAQLSPSLESILKMGGMTGDALEEFYDGNFTEETLALLDEMMVGDITIQNVETANIGVIEMPEEPDEGELIQADETEPVYMSVGGGIMTTGKMNLADVETARLGMIMSGREMDYSLDAEEAMMDLMAKMGFVNVTGCGNVTVYEGIMAMNDVTVTNCAKFMFEGGIGSMGGDVTVTGGDSLTVINEGVIQATNVTIEDIETVNVSMIYTGPMYSSVDEGQSGEETEEYGNVTITGCDDVTCGGIMAMGDVTITGFKELTIQDGELGVAAEGGSVTITGADANAVISISAYAPAVLAGNTAEIKNAKTLTLESEAGLAIMNGQGGITMENIGELVAAGSIISEGGNVAFVNVQGTVEASDSEAPAVMAGEEGTITASHSTVSIKVLSGEDADGVVELPLTDNVVDTEYMNVYCYIGEAMDAPNVEDFTVTDETESGKNDGSIAGVTSAMEWRTEGGEWTDGTGDKLEDLAPGTYQIRNKAADGKRASGLVEVEVSAGQSALTDAEKVAAAKIVIENTLNGMTFTNDTTKEAIQSEVDAALAEAGHSDVDAIVGEITVDRATTEAAGSVTGSVAISCGGESDSVAFNKPIAELPTDAEKVTRAKEVIENTLNGMTFTNDTTQEGIQSAVDAALAEGGLSDVTATVTVTKANATTSAAGSVTGSVGITCGEANDTVAIDKSITQLPPAPSRPSSGSGSTPTVDVPMSNNENKVDVKAEVSGKDATIKPLDDKQIEQLVGDENASGDVVVDLSNLGKTIDTAGIPKKTLETIVDAAEDAGNNTEHLVIKLSTAELKLDDAAMRAIVDQADGDIIKFNFDDVGLGRLNKEQKEAVKDMDVRKGYEAYITVNGQRIGDFKGGEVEIIVPYAVPAGENVAGFSVWYIDENGKPEKQKSTYDGKEKCFVVTHFSDYVIVYNEDDAQAGSYMVCTKDETCPIHPYTDASTTEWYHDGVHYCIDNGLMSGYGNGIFKPDADTTRAMITVMLWRLNGSPVVDYQLDFEDVAEGQWYTEAIRWAKSEGVVTGYGNGFFGTNDAVTREQMVTILWRYAQYKGVDVSVGENTNILSYGDAFDIAEYAIPAMQWACGSGMVQGMSDTDGDGMILAPESKGTRAQIATMMMRFCENIVK